MAEGFKEGLKQYYPETEIVGVEYHKLFLTHFAPYLAKVKASGAEAIYTGDWIPDAANLLKQARQMGITLPIANTFLDESIKKAPCFPAANSKCWRSTGYSNQVSGSLGGLRVSCCEMPVVVACCELREKSKPREHSA